MNYEAPAGRPKQSAKLLSFEIGQRVRDLRRKQSMTRRQLSEATAISERYLGQLENGQANASVNILHKIATHFGVQVSNLVPADAATALSYQPLADLLARLNTQQQEAAFHILNSKLRQDQTNCKGIALVGLRGAGKTTLGQELSDLTEVPFVRLSQLVVERAGMETPEIMELGGPAAFRRFEFEALKELIDQPGKVVLETSGGIVANHASYDLLIEHFHTVWLSATPEEHMQRVIDQHDLRPMIGRSAAMKDLMALMREREPAYSRADSVVHTSGRTLRDCLAELVTISKPVICV